MNLEYLNTFFDKVYVISLKRSTERQEHVKNVLREVEFTFFWGVDGRKLDKTDLIDENVYSEEKAIEFSFDNLGMSLGEIGCALSHIKIYEDVVKNNFQRVLIFEDDLFLNNQIDIDIKKCLSELPEKWDLVYLGDLGNNDKISTKNFIKLHVLYPVLGIFSNRFNRKRLRDHYPRKYSNNLDYAGLQWGLHAYGVTNKCSKILLEELLPLTREVDTAIGLLTVNRIINSYRFRKKLFVQNRSFESVIGKRHEWELN